MSDTQRVTRPWRTAGGDGAWPSSVAVGLVLGVALSAHFLFGWLSTPWLGPPAVGPDMWGATTVASAIAHGNLHHIYGLSLYDSLPVWPLLLAPLMAVADALGLRSSPGPVPSLAYLVVPACSLVGIVVAHAGRTLARELGTRQRLWLVQSTLAATVMLPCLAWGHVEDALAVAAFMYALAFLRQGHLDAAALSLGAAIGLKEWALLAAPMILAAVGPRYRRFALLLLAPPVLAGSFALAVDHHDALRQLLAPSAFSHNHGLRYGISTVLGPRGSRLTRPVVLGACVLTGLFGRRHGRVVLAVGVTAAILVRPLSEPILFPYYLVPAVAFLAVTAAGSYRRPPLRVFAVAAALTVWATQMGMRSDLWWPVALAGLAVLARASVPAIAGLLGPGDDRRPSVPGDRGLVLAGVGRP